MNFLVIRGADTYFGNTIAKELSKLGKNVLLLGSEVEILKNLESEIRQNGKSKVFCFRSDDSSTDSIIRICDHINDYFAIDMLLNYTETDISQRFVDSDIFSLDRSLKINYVSAPVYTHQLLPNLLLRTNAYIVNVIGFLESTSQYAEILKQLNENFSRYLQVDMKDFDIKVASWDMQLVKASKDFHDHNCCLEKINEFLQDLFCQRWPVKSL